MVKKAIFLVAFCFWFFSVLPYAHPEDVADISLPAADNGVFIVKKPKIVCKSTQIDYKTVKVVMLDDTDITNIVTIKNGYLVFNVLVPLPSGEHTLSIVYGKEGEKQKDFTFSTKQTKVFDEFTTKLSATTTYKNTVKKSDTLNDIPHYSVESNPTVDMQVANPNWSVSFNMSTRYLEQSIKIESPQKRGIDLAGYLFSAKYNKNEFNAHIDIGDIQVDESDYSAQGLASRGGKFGVGYESYRIETFIMDAQQRYGFKDGMGLDVGSTNSIYGASFEKTFFEETRLKAVYIKGSKNGDGFGSASMNYTGSVVRKGRVAALVLSTPIFKEKLNLSSEIDFASYDDNIFDNVGYKNDKAYNVKIGGNLGEHYQYSAKYEYIGTDYYSIGNEGLENDKKGILITGAANYEFHNFGLTFSRYRDNLKNYDNVPIVYITSGKIDYSCSLFEHFPINLSVKRDIVKSKREPDKTSKQHLVTDTYHGDISYLAEQFGTTFGVDYSYANDKTDVNADQKIVTYTLSPSYSIENFNVSSNISFNRSVDIKSDVAVRTWSAGLSFGGNFLKHSISYNCAGTYTKTKSSDGMQNSRNLSTTFQVAYTWSAPEKFIVLKNPSIGIQGGYNHNKDKVGGTTRDEVNIILFVEVPLEYVF